VGCCYAAGAFSFWSVLGLFLGNDLFLGNNNNGVVFSLGSVPRWYFLWGPFRGGIFFGVRSEGIFLCLLACLLPCLRVSKFCESEMATKDTHLVL
jgi:hypothetical protein